MARVFAYGGRGGGGRGRGRQSALRLHGQLPAPVFRRAGGRRGRRGGLPFGLSVLRIRSALLGFRFRPPKASPGPRTSPALCLGTGSCSLAAGAPESRPALSAVSDAPCSSARSGGRNHPTNPPTSRWLTLAARERPIPQRSRRRTRVSPRNSVVPATRGRLARSLFSPASVGAGVPRTTSRRSTTMTG